MAFSDSWENVYFQIYCDINIDNDFIMSFQLQYPQQATKLLTNIHVDFNHIAYEKLAKVMSRKYGKIRQLKLINELAWKINTSD